MTNNVTINNNSLRCISFSCISTRTTDDNESARIPTHGDSTQVDDAPSLRNISSGNATIDPNSPPPRRVTTQDQRVEIGCMFFKTGEHTRTTVGAAIAVRPTFLNAVVAILQSIRRATSGI